MFGDVILRGFSIAACLALAIGCTAPSQSNDKKASNKQASNTLVSEPARVAASIWLSGPASQGALLTGQVPEGATALRFDGQNILIENDGFFVIGFDRDAEPTSKLVAIFPDGRAVEKMISVTPYKWALSYVNAASTGGAKNEADLAARRPSELQQIGVARTTVTNAKGWRQDMVWPIRYWTISGGRVSGLFGRQRFYQGKPGSPHGGLDIAAASGTPFVAPADGVVVLAARGAPFTLEGRLLILDHGNGLNSAFLHCSELLVEVGQSVKQGQVIGKVGNTGRTEGAHLHWGLRWKEARVDPLRLVPRAPTSAPLVKKK